jgi:hypothetical protein
MPFRTVAYHPSVAPEKLASSSQDIAVGTGIRCAKYRLTFAAVCSVRHEHAERSAAAQRNLYAQFFGYDFTRVRVGKVWR